MVEVEVWAAFYRGIETFRWAMVGGESKCWSNGGFDEVKMKKCN